MRRQRRTARSPGARAHLLLLLAVLAGVVAMHGLGPVPADPSALRAPHHSTPVTARSSADHHCGGGERATHEDGTSGGHAEHADSTCAATGVGSAPAQTPPAPSALPEPPAQLFARVPEGSLLSGRAPPSLSELQLLRI